MTTRTLPSSYAQADAVLMGGRSHDERPVANNTRLVRRGDAIALRLHSTDIVTYQPDGSLGFHTGGWMTLTTRQRMNAALPAPWRICQSRGRWYVFDYSAREDVGRFDDGATLSADGVWTLPETDDAAEDILERRMNAYIRGYVRALRSGIPMPGPGDCWPCAMVTEDGTTLGDTGFAADHLESHLAERYYVPSLLVNAYRERGFGDWRFVLAMHLDYERLERGGGMRLRRAWQSDEADAHAAADVARVLRRYLKPRLLPGVAQ